MLIFLFLMKLLATGDTIGDREEIGRDIAILIMYLLEAFCGVLIGTVICRMFFAKLSKRKIESLFLYAFGFLFLPNYLIIHFAYNTFIDDEEALGGISALLILCWLIYLMIYFYKGFHRMSDKKMRSFAAAFIGAASISLLLFLSLFMIVGASYVRTPSM